LSVQGQGILTANTTDVTVSGNITTGGYLLGNGAFLEGITSSNASSLTEGQLLNSLLPSTIGNGSTTFVGNSVDVSGNITTGGYLLGNGAFLEGVASSNASSLTEGQLLNSLLPPTIGNTSTNFVGDGQYLSNVSRGVRSTLIANADLTTVTLVANALQSVTPEAVHVHVNGIQLAYIDANVADYTITTTQDLANVTTAFEITLTDPLSNGDVVDVLVSTGASLNESSNGAYYETVYANSLEVYDVTFGGNAVLSSADTVTFTPGNVHTTVDGTALTPSYAWTSANTTGFYLEGANVGVTVEGTQKAHVSTDGVRVDGNVVCTGTFVGDGSGLTGISQPVTLTGVQITDDTWNAIDDTALTSNVGGYCVLTGSNFAPGSIAVVGGTNASATAYVSSTQLRVHAPAKASGSYTVSVIRSGDGASASLPSGITYSETITWITDSQLGNVDAGVSFSIPIQAVSDSTVSYSNVSPLPPSTTLNPTTGALAGTITGVSDATFSFDIRATDQEYQDAVRSFIMRCIGVYVSQIVGATYHTLALSNLGRLAGWGYNNYGQTGVGNTASVTLPVDITDKGSLAGRTITAVACGDYHSAALTSDGAVSCWGRNDYGQCGQNHTTTPQLTPVVVGGVLAGKTVTAIACGRNHTLALAGGVVYAWGENNYGHIGNGTTGNVLTPVAIGGSLNAKTVVQIRGGTSHSMALASDGTVHMWGRRGDGQIPGGTSGAQLTPVDVSGYGALIGQTVVDIQSGGYYCLVLCSDSSVISWGYNGNGQVGVGNNANENTPQDITSNGSLVDKTVTKIFIGSGASAHTSFAIASDGSVHAWGSGGLGTIGDGGGVDRTLPVNISSFGALGGQPISRLGGGDYGVFAMRDDEQTVTGWGHNAYYNLGDGTNTNRTTPVDVTTNIMAVLDP